jgi:hypothetical protein
MPQRTLHKNPKGCIPPDFPGAFKSAAAVLVTAGLRPAAMRCLYLVCRHFFGFQYKSALFPGRVPVSWSDHPLDETIPFLPGFVKTYLSFIPFWVRITGFLLLRCKRKDLARDFLTSIGNLYLDASAVYRKNLSTTKRPFYIKNISFLLIHMSDPHLMCIPSLHVMIVIRCYTRTAKYCAAEPLPLKNYCNDLLRHAVAITEAVLLIKQHSVNCIAAAMYAMTVLDPELFPRREALYFASLLFRSPLFAPGGNPDSAAMRTHIVNLYQRFLDEYHSALSAARPPERIDKAAWTVPLLEFLKTLPPAGAKRS